MNKTQAQGVVLDEEELELERTLGSAEQIQELPLERERFAAIARNTLQKTERINIRFTAADLLAVKRRAAREGLPYQTLISSVVHKYVTGEL